MTPNTPHTSWEGRTARGAIIRTFSDRALALEWWDDPNRETTFPGSRLDEVTRELREVRRTVRRPALQVVRSA